MNRYWDTTVKNLVTEYKELMETKNAFVKKFALQVYAAFDESYAMWLSAVQSIAEIDALMGLAKGSMNMGGKPSRAEIRQHTDVLTIHGRTCVQTYFTGSRKECG